MIKSLKKEKKTIKEIFEDNGEDYFRMVEKIITLEELKKINSVIALGGGAFINPSIRKEAKNLSDKSCQYLKFKDNFNQIKKY